ncbi:MAG: type I phosphomannose isomerase catalytic subunit [Gemmataceae bacterium]
MPNYVELEPRFQQALWGGRKLARLPGAPADGPISEAWMVSDVAGKSSRIARGTHAGETLHDTLSLFGRFNRFPLLVKLIDARLPLSVQVHPDDVKARSVAGADLGKTEAWVVLDAEPGSRIYAGLRDGVRRPDFEQAIKAERMEDVLHWFEPKSGDGVFLPAGTVHALGGGVTIFEVQQTSDITYRLSDWGRVDPATKKPRVLHIDEGLACINFESGAVQPRRSVPLTIECEYFQLSVNRAATDIGGDGKCRVLVSYGGKTTGCVDVYPEAAVILSPNAGICRLTPEPGAWLLEAVIP